MPSFCHQDKELVPLSQYSESYESIVSSSEKSSRFHFKLVTVTGQWIGGETRREWLLCEEQRGSLLHPCVCPLPNSLQP